MVYLQVFLGKLDAETCVGLIRDGFDLHSFLKIGLKPLCSENYCTAICRCRDCDNRITGIVYNKLITTIIINQRRAWCLPAEGILLRLILDIKCNRQCIAAIASRKYVQSACVVRTDCVTGTFRKQLGVHITDRQHLFVVCKSLVVIGYLGPVKISSIRLVGIILFAVADTDFFAVVDVNLSLCRKL